MGLDIFIRTDKNPEFDETVDDESNFANHGLSRTFCNLMNRQHAVGSEPELDQIGRIVAVDISPLYEMENYQEDDSEELEAFLHLAETEEERASLLEEAGQSRMKIQGNIERVLELVNTLIDRLSVIDNLPQMLDDGGHDTLNSREYFADFNVDKGDGYIGNNFGQDLRNFRRILEDARSRGATIVYFRYG
jgi:hypothetical protein